MSVAVAACFVWLGMVIAISFIEAPIKFRAPGVTTRIGLGIGRLVFRVLNAVESALAIALLLAVLLSDPPASAAAWAFAAIVALALQLAAVRPALNRRTAAVLAGAPRTGSRAHYGYIALEVVKAVALAVAGALLLGAL